MASFGLRQSIIAFGGSLSSAPMWEWDGNAWSPVATVTDTGIRFGMTLAGF